MSSAGKWAWPMSPWIGFSGGWYFTLWNPQSPNRLKTLWGRLIEMWGLREVNRWGLCLWEDLRLEPLLLQFGSVFLANLFLSTTTLPFRKFLLPAALKGCCAVLDTFNASLRCPWTPPPVPNFYKLCCYRLTLGTWTLLPSVQAGEEPCIIRNCYVT